MAAIKNVVGRAGAPVVQNRYPAKPMNPTSSMGAPDTTQEGPGAANIRSNYPATPVSPGANQGKLENVQ